MKNNTWTAGGFHTLGTRVTLPIPPRWRCLHYRFVWVVSPQTWGEAPSRGSPFSTPRCGGLWGRRAGPPLPQRPLRAAESLPAMGSPPAPDPLRRCLSAQPPAPLGVYGDRQTDRPSRYPPGPGTPAPPGAATRAPHGEGRRERLR